MLLLYCKQFNTSLDASVWLEMLLCSWKPFYASFDRTVQLEMLLSSRKQFYASLDRSVQQETLMQLEATLYKSGQIWERGNALTPLETILCEHGRICATGNGLVQLEPNLCNWLLAGTPFLIFPPKFELECAEPIYVVMTHHTAKANLEKGSCWPSEAIPYGVPHIRGLVLTWPISPTPWTWPWRSLGPGAPLRFDY